MKARLMVLTAVSAMLAFGGVQIGAQNGESEQPALRDFPAPFVREGKAQLVIIADEADLPTAQRLGEALGQWTSDTIEVIGDREDYPWWETDIIVVGGPGENEIARHLNGEEDLLMPFVPKTSAGDRLRYGISWRFKLWEEPGSGTLQLFHHSYSGGKRHYALLIAGVDPEGTAVAAEALLAMGPQMPGRAAFVTDGRIEVMVDPPFAPDLPVICLDAPVDYAFKDGMLRVETWPTADLFPDGMALALVHNIYLEGEVWEGGMLGGIEEEFGGYLMEELPLRLRMVGLRELLKRLAGREFALPELSIDSVDLKSGAVAIELRDSGGSVDRFRLPPRTSYRRLILRGEGRLQEFATGEPCPYGVLVTVELELSNLGLGHAMWSQRSDRFFPQGFIAVALAIHIHSLPIRELEWG